MRSTKSHRHERATDCYANHERLQVEISTSGAQKKGVGGLHADGAGAGTPLGWGAEARRAGRRGDRVSSMNAVGSSGDTGQRGCFYLHVEPLVHKFRGSRGEMDSLGLAAKRAHTGSARKTGGRDKGRTPPRGNVARRTRNSGSGAGKPY